MKDDLWSDQVRSPTTGTLSTDQARHPISDGLHSSWHTCHGKRIQHPGAGCIPNSWCGICRAWRFLCISQSVQSLAFRNWNIQSPWRVNKATPWIVSTRTGVRDATATTKSFSKIECIFIRVDEYNSIVFLEMEDTSRFYKGMHGIYLGKSNQVGLLGSDPSSWRCAEGWGI